MDRPFVSYKIDELEEAFEERCGDKRFLELLVEELKHRNSQRASTLREKARFRLHAPPQDSAYSPKPPSPEPISQIIEAPRREETASPVIAPHPSRPGTPEATLDAWIALEVLSPQSFLRPENLAVGGDKSAVVRIGQGPLPWEAGGERSKKNYRLYYQVVLGALHLEETVKRILDVYVDKRVERPGVRGRAALATITVDREGRLVETSPVGLSSFGWGVPHALAGDLGKLAAWPVAEEGLLKALEDRLRRQDGDGNELPLTQAMLSEAYEWLVAALELPEELVEAPTFAIRSFQYFKFPDPPEPLLLNSFFLGDLARAKEAFGSGRATPNLRRYLGVDPSALHRNLLQEVSALEEAVAPARTPPARWPGKGRHPLVLLQQAAVNAAMTTLRESGILAVNGPPGTGKTTLLRDLVAALVTARAEVMVGFDDPQQAFTHSGEKVKAGQAWLHLYRVDPRLKGFEILVASSNNKAVENVSAELPGADALAQDAGLTYFSCLSDALHDSKKTWGLIAGVLGNMANRSKFRQTFWWDVDVGMSTYLAAAAGTPQFISEADPHTGEEIKRSPRIVAEEKPPADHEQALARWRKARGEFRKALKVSQNRLAELEGVRYALRNVSAAAEREADAERALIATREEASFAEGACAQAAGLARALESVASQAREALREHDRYQPGFFARLFNTDSAREWQVGREPLSRAERKARSDYDDASRKYAEWRDVLRARRNAFGDGERRLSAAADEHAALRKTVEAAYAGLGSQIADDAFFMQSHEERHKATPWLDASAQRARDDVFVAAMRLHKAFIDAAAKPLRHNLGNLMNVFSGKAMPDQAKAALVPDLWTSLFFVVPLFSTTFASVERMLRGLPTESLGWLLVDEAGQALPQAAVGALMRTRCAVVVGDPLQIEPVVVLPDTLTQTICRQLGADPDRFNAPEASVQTLADAATPYMAEFEGRLGSREVGVPLLVHRRCGSRCSGYRTPSPTAT